MDVYRTPDERFAGLPGYAFEPRYVEQDGLRMHYVEEGSGAPVLLPRADLVITHAGNNTTTECFHFGKPMIALPLFWDQYDNAQRVAETGYGIRLQTYEFEDGELIGAVDRLLADEVLRSRMAGIAARVQASPGTVRAADLIERLARNQAPVIR